MVLETTCDRNHPPLLVAMMYDVDSKGTPMPADLSNVGHFRISVIGKNGCDLRVCGHPRKELALLPRMTGNHL